jgi:hypothetical protein
MKRPSGLMWSFRVVGVPDGYQAGITRTCNKFWAPLGWENHSGTWRMALIPADAPIHLSLHLVLQLILLISDANVYAYVMSVVCLNVVALLIACLVCISHIKMSTQIVTIAIYLWQGGWLNMMTSTCLFLLNPPAAALPMWTSQNVLPYPSRDVLPLLP